MIPDDDQAPVDPWYGGSRWLVTAVAMSVLSFGMSLDTPGIDNLAIAAMNTGPLLPVMGSSVGLLVLLRLALDAGTNEDRRPVVPLAVLYLVLSALGAFWAADAAQYIEVFNVGAVIEPGLAFVTLATITGVGGAAAFWGLADWVDREGVGSGALMLGGLMAASFAGGALRMFGEGIGLGMGATPSALAPVVVAMASAMALGIATPTRWPQRVGPLILRSPLDVLALPLVVWFLAKQAMALLMLWVPAVAGALGVFTAVALGVALRRNEDAKPRLSWGFLAALPPIAGVVMIAVGFTASGGASRLLTPGPFDGPSNVRIVISSPDGVPDDKATLEERLAGIGVRATVTEVPSGLQLDLQGIASAKAVTDAVLPRSALGIHAVVENPSAAPIVVQECDQRQPPVCNPMGVEPAVITGAHIADAGVGFDPMGQPIVAITLTSAGAATFGAMTKQHVDKRLAIVVDGRVKSAPTVREPILGGKVQISMGYGSPDPEADAQALAVALRTPSLVGTWSVASVTQLP